MKKGGLKVSKYIYICRECLHEQNTDESPGSVCPKCGAVAVIQKQFWLKWKAEREFKTIKNKNGRKIRIPVSGLKDYRFDFGVIYILRVP
jgi:DNA-directed RNA polymerase subunit RPC12/RpoP